MYYLSIFIQRVILFFAATLLTIWFLTDPMHVFIIQIQKNYMVFVMSSSPRFAASQHILKNQKLQLSTSCCINNRWRREQGLEPNPNRYGPLTNLPDFSYVDGRPVPLSYRKRVKIERQRKYCAKIAQLSYELDDAIEQYKLKEKENEAKIKEILDSKLKPKGIALLKKKT